MTIAVPRYLHLHLEKTEGIPPGHWFRLYFGGWWTRELEQARIRWLEAKATGEDQGRRRRELERKVEKSKRKLEETCSFAELDNEARAFFLLQVFGKSRKEELGRLTEFDGAGIPAFGKCSLQLTEKLVGRQKAAVGETGALIRQVTTSAPFTTGLGNEHPLENGFSFLDPYGLPYLPGSGVKGVVRRAAEELALFEADGKGWTIPAVWWLFGFDATSAFFAPDTKGDPKVIAEEREAWRRAYRQHLERLDGEGKTLLDAFCRAASPHGKDESEQVLAALRGEGARELLDHLHLRGALEFWDVIPEPADGKLRLDIMNPHYNHYYQGDKPEHPHGQGDAVIKPPGDWRSPVPIYFLTLPPGTMFTFVVRLRPPLQWPDEVRMSLEPRWQALTEAALRFAWEWQGFGAKTAVGYGRMGDGNPRSLPTLHFPKGPGGA